jgi:ribose transport system substrate-binding protein
MKTKLRNCLTFQGNHIATCIAIGIGLVTHSPIAHSTDSASSGERSADIRTMCGTKPAVVALTDGYGGTWRKITEAEFRDEAAKCPNIKKVIYVNANGDQQKSNSDINSLVAQGVNVLVSFVDFGDAMLPALRSAQKAGVSVVPYFSQISGTPGRDYVANVRYDGFRDGEMWADWLGTTLKSGNVVMLGGPPGASSSVGIMSGLRAGLKKYPGMKLLDDNYIVTNWNPVDAQKAASGLIAKYPKVDAIAADFGGTTLAAVKAYQQTGLPVPTMVSFATTNEVSCKYLDDGKKGAGWRYMALDGTNTLVRAALRRGLASYEGTTDNEPSTTVPRSFADSNKGLAPKCDSSAPPDADFSSSLSPAQLKKLF